jgi:purine-binding chemotaxis protein CheW
VSEGGRADLAALHRARRRMERVLAQQDEVPEERRREILRVRARFVAAARATEDDDQLVALAFRVGGERYAIQLSELAMVLSSRGLSPLAGAPRWLLGAILARGRLVPVLDLRQLLQLEGGGMGDLASIVVVESEGDVFGVAVESLDGYVHFPRAAGAHAAQGSFRHVTADRVAVLDPGALAHAAGALG